MKVFAIIDEDLSDKRPIGYLFCYEKANEYVIELEDDLTEWEAPLLFQELVKKGIYTIPKNSSILWVRERVIPSGRQNIGLILKNANLTEYNERKLLALSGGKCSQDQCYVTEISESEVPERILKRKDTNVEECFPAEDGTIICMFRDQVVSKVDLRKLEETDRGIEHLLRNERLLETVKPGIGGYSIVFGSGFEIQKDILREERFRVPLSTSDFYCFLRKDVFSAAEACERLGCTKQNLSYLVKTGKIEPLIHGARENFYSGGAIQRLVDL